MGEPRPSPSPVTFSGNAGPPTNLTYSITLVPCGSDRRCIRVSLGHLLHEGVTEWPIGLSSKFAEHVLIDFHRQLTDRSWRPPSHGEVIDRAGLDLLAEWD